MTRLLIVGPLPPPYYGMSVATELLMAALADEPCTIDLLDTADRRGFISQGRFDFRNVSLAVRHGAVFTWKLLVGRPKLVYVPIAQNAPGLLRDLLFLVPARLVGASVVVHLHGAALPDFLNKTNPALASAVRWALRDVSSAIVLGPGGERLFAGTVPADRVVVIPNGLPDEPNPPRHVESSTPGGGRVLYLSTIMAEKGFLDVLRALPTLVRRNPDVELTVAGDWFRSADRDEALSFIEGEGLAAHVRFVGTVSPSTRSELLRNSDVFVLTPRHLEGMPYAILEAMRAGVPVVTTQRGFIPTMVIDGETGIVLSDGEPGGIADALSTLLSDGILRERLGCAGRRRYLQHFTFERWATNMRRLLLEGQGDS